jgi:AcrR family transcriptional regulator
MTNSSSQSREAGRVARRRAATRARLLAAAQRLAGAGAPVTVAQIAAEADVALASFYTHFESKEALFAELIRDTMAELAARLAALSADTDPALAFAAALRAFWAWFAEDLDRSRYVLRGAHANDVLGPTVGTTLATLIERGRLAGRFRVASTEVAAFLIGGGIIGATGGHLSGRLTAPDLDIELTTQALQLLGLPPRAARKAATDPRTEDAALPPR